MRNNGLLKKAALVVTIVTGLALLANAFDNHYAKASDVQALSTLVFDFKLSELRRELWALLIAGDKRELTDRERLRKLELEAEIAKVESLKQGK